MTPSRMTRSLGIGFLVYGALLASSLWHHLTVTMPLLSGQPVTHSAFTALKSVGKGGFLLEFLWLGLVLCAAVGLFKAARWARWLGLFLIGSVPIGYLNRGLLFGAATVVTPTSVCVLLASILIFLFLWKSRQAQEMFGRDPKAARSAWVGLAVLCVMPVMLFGFVIYIKAKHGAPRYIWTNRTIHSVSQQIEGDFVQRELLDYRVFVPRNARIMLMSATRPEVGGASVVLQTPDENMFLITDSKAIGELVWQVGQAVGMSSPYAVHRHVLRSRWNVIFVILQAISIPGHGDDVQVTEVEAPEWRALVIQGRRKDAVRAEYSIYDRKNPLQTASCSWNVKAGALDLSQIERSMDGFEFVPTMRTQSQYMQEAEDALTNGRQLEAQFALAQAYLHGENNPVVTRKLADVSAELGSWHFVKELAQELLADDPENPELKALHERAVKAFEQQDAGGSNEGTPPLTKRIISLK